MEAIARVSQVVEGDDPTRFSPIDSRRAVPQCHRSMRNDTPGTAHGIVLFDGVCNLCNASVLFILDRDARGHFRFATLQSEAGVKALRAHGREAATGDPDSVVLIEGDRVYDRSDAGLRIARRLSGAWPVLAVFLVMPRFLRDAVYKLISRNRYRWFGRTEACRIPTPALRARFLT